MTNATDDGTDIGDILGTAGAPPEIECNGRVWRIGFPTQRAKTRLNELLIGITEDELESMEGVVSPKRFKKLEDSFNADLKSGKYKTWGDGWANALGSQRGGIAFFLSLLRENHPDATEADALLLLRECGEKCQRAMLRVAPPFFSALADDHPAVMGAKESERESAKAKLLGTMMPQFLKMLSRTTPNEQP